MRNLSSFSLPSYLSPYSNPSANAIPIFLLQFGTLAGKMRRHHHFLIAPFNDFQSNASSSSSNPEDLILAPFHPTYLRTRIRLSMRYQSSFCNLEHWQDASSAFRDCSIRRFSIECMSSKHRYSLDNSTK